MTRGGAAMERRTPKKVVVPKVAVRRRGSRQESLGQAGRPGGSRRPQTVDRGDGLPREAAATQALMRLTPYWADPRADRIILVGGSVRILKSAHGGLPVQAPGRPG